MDILPVSLVSLVPAAVCILLLHVCTRSIRFAARARGRLLPPGPTPLPIVGNLFDIPKVTPWREYAKLGRKYGKIIHFRLLGQSIVIINDVHTAIQLLEKRSAIYSSRPHMNMATLTGCDWNLAVLPYGSWWRRHRRALWQHFYPGIIHRYHSVQYAAVRRLLVRLYDDAEKLKEHITYAQGTAALQAAYGLNTVDFNDIYMPLIEDVAASGEFLVPGASILEYLPFLARLPTWLPGTGLLRLKRLAQIRESVEAFRTLPWDNAKQNINTDIASSNSITSTMLAEFSHPDGNAAVEEEIAKNVMGSIYVAGVDTTTISLCAFFVAISLHGDVQKKAQAELDAIVGPARLPKLADRDALPYINAIVKETLRWHATAPLGIPHASTADDEYEGYFIPENTVVFYNAWAMLNDPETYSQPERFMPERFLKDDKLNPDVKDPATIMFGFGRRICPGRYFADETLFLNIASVLHTFNITPPVDEQGKPIKAVPQVATNLISHIENCKCIITPRSDRAVLIHSSDSAESSFSSSG